MALKQKIDPLKLVLQFHEMNISDDCENRMSLLDVIVLLIINEHPDSGKMDLTEILYGDRNASKSSMDRPITRMLNHEFIEAVSNRCAATRHRETRVYYRLTRKGEAFLKKTYYS